eukprot:g14112.t1
MRRLRPIDIVRSLLNDPTATTSSAAAATANSGHGVTADDLRAADGRRFEKAIEKGLHAQTLLERFSADDYDKHSFLEDLQQQIFRNCVEKYIDQRCSPEGELDKKKSGDDRGGQRRTRKQVIDNTYHADKIKSRTGIPLDQYPMDGVIAAKQPFYCRLLFAWKAAQVKLAKAEKAAEDAKAASGPGKPADPHRADDGDALPSRREKAAPAGNDKKTQQSTTAGAAAKQKQQQQEQVSAILKQLEENRRADDLAAGTLKPSRPRAVLQLRPKAASTSSSSVDDDTHHYFYVGLILASSTPGIAGARLTRRQTAEGVAEWVIGVNDDGPHQMLVSHLPDSVSRYDLESAKVFEAVPGLCSSRDAIAFHMTADCWQPESGVVPDHFGDGSEDDDAGPQGKKRKKSDKPSTNRIWSNVKVNAPTARGGEAAAGSDPQTTGAEHKPAGASSGGAAGQQGGWEGDAEKRRCERERIAKFLAENQDAGGPGGNNKKLLPGKDYNIAAATRIMKCSILVQEYWNIFYQAQGAATGTGSNRKGSAEAWLLFDAPGFFSSPPSSGVKQRGVKDYGDAGASALLVLWAHRAVFLARNFDQPTPAQRSAAELKTARQVYDTFCKEAREECARLKILVQEVDRFGAADDSVFTYLRPLSETGQGRGRAQAGVRVKHEVADEDLDAPFSSLRAPGADGVADDFGFDDDSAGTAEHFDDNIGEVADAYDVDYENGGEEDE